MMEIILKGGPHHGTRGKVSEGTTECLMDRLWVYKIADKLFPENRQVFQLDEDASAERLQKKRALPPE